MSETAIYFMEEAPLLMSEEEERLILLRKKAVEAGQVFEDWRQIAMRLPNPQWVVVAEQEEMGKIVIYSRKPLFIDSPDDCQIAKCNFIGGRFLRKKMLFISRSGVFEDMPPFLN